MTCKSQKCMTTNYFYYPDTINKCNSMNIVYTLNAFMHFVIRCGEKKLCAQRKQIQIHNFLRHFTSEKGGRKYDMKVMVLIWKNIKMYRFIIVRVNSILNKSTITSRNFLFYKALDLTVWSNQVQFKYIGHTYKSEIDINIRNNELIQSD